jgi:hypothetical protein
MSSWFQPSSPFLSNPTETRRWGFSAMANPVRSPFTQGMEGAGPRSANAMYGLMPDHTPGYGSSSEEFMSQTLVPGWQNTGEGRNPFAGIEFTDCS